MRQRWPVVIVVSVVLGICSGSLAGDASLLLETGICLEETAGDLDRAVEIYQKIIKDAEANRRYVAKAHYRLGMCYLKKGQKAQAHATFEELIANFPEQTRLVEAARNRLPGRMRYFVRLVLGENGALTFEGQSTTWEELPLLLEDVPNRAQTVLEFAIALDRLSVADVDITRRRAVRFIKRFGFKYFSYIGVHPLGSKGSPAQKVALEARAAGLIGHWKFDGNANDLVGDHDGDVQGATLTDGVSGLAYYFDGEDDYISLGRMSSMQNLSMAISSNDSPHAKPAMARGSCPARRKVLGLSIPPPSAL